MATSMHTKILDMYLGGYSNIEILEKLGCNKSEISKVFSRMTEEHHLNLKMRSKDQVSQIGNIEARLFDRIHKMSDSEYKEVSGIYSKFLVK